MTVDIERRAGAPRVPFHSLVEVGAGQDGSAAFEAEAVDVTTDGMRLKTAYLPQHGESLVCRFEGAGTEIVVQGQVAWCIEDGYGGDFGVRFLKMDQLSLDALRSMVGHVEVDDSESASTANLAVPSGARVRLHIEGLGAPMKARVRDGSNHEVMVGSNLEFLRVGRSVDLENVDGKANRPARIERIAVEVDPESHIPQLVVGLRFTDIVAQQDDPVITYAHDDADAHDEMYDEYESEQEDDNAYASEQESQQAEAQRDEDGWDEDDAHASGDEDADEYGDDYGEEYGDEEGDADDAEYADESRAARLRGAVWSKIKKVGPALGAVGGVAKTWGTKAAASVGDAVSSAKQKAAEKKRDNRQTKTLRRTTSAPPNGGIQVDGVRGSKRTQRSVAAASVRASDSSSTGKKGLKKRINKRNAGIALAAVVVCVAGFSLARSMWQTDSVKASDETTAEAFDEASGEAILAINSGNSAGEQAVDPPIVPGAMGQDQAAVGIAGVPMANVPLFGPTPITTAALLAPMGAVPVAQVAAATPPPGDTGDDTSLGAVQNTAQNMESDEDLDEAAGAAIDDATGASPMKLAAIESLDEDDESDESSAQESSNSPRKASTKTAKKSGKKAEKKSKASSDTKTASVKSFGRGRVSNPIILSLRMNQPIKDLRGVAKSDGFSVDIIGARSEEPAAGLRKYDSRIASASVMNSGKNAQLKIRFKQAAPGYRVQANGSSLRILIDGSKKGATASASARGKKAR